MSAQIPSNALPVDFVVADWRIEQVLDAGAIGIAYRAVNAERAETVAIIEYLPDGMVARAGEGNHSVQARSPDDARLFAQGREQFLAEARMLARVSHPNVARVHRAVEANSTAYLVMAHEAGDSLEAFLERSGKRLNEEDVKRFARGLLDGTAAIHAAGFHHGALTPAAIRVRSDFSPVLFEAITMLQAREQVPGYSPIEQYAHDSPQGPATDIYAIAAVLYRMIGGRAPLDAASRLLDERHVSAADLGAARYDRVFLRAIDAGLAVRPEERPQSIAAWRKQFDAPAKSQRKSATIRIPEGWRQPEDEPRFFAKEPPPGRPPEEPSFDSEPTLGERPVDELPDDTAEADSPLTAGDRPPEEPIVPPPGRKPERRPWLVGGAVLAVCAIIGAATAVGWRVSQDQQPSARQQFEQLLAQHPSAEAPSADAQAQAKAEEAARQREAERQQAIAEAQARTKAADVARAREAATQREREVAEAQARTKAAEEARAREAAAQRELETAAAQARAKAAEEAKAREAAEARARAKAAEEAKAREVAEAQARARAVEEARAREAAQAQAGAREAAAQREREAAATRMAREAEQARAREAAQQRQQEQAREAEAAKVAAIEEERLRDQAQRRSDEARRAASPAMIEESSAEPRYVLVPGLPKLSNGGTPQRQVVVTNGSQVGHIESVNNSWGFVVVQMDRRQGVEVGDRVYARDGNEKLWMRVTRVRGSQISATPEALLWRYALNLSVFKD